MSGARAALRAVGVGLPRDVPATPVTVQDRSIRVSWKAELRAELRGFSAAQPTRRFSPGCEKVHQRSAAGTRLRGPAHARRRRQCAHQHSGQLRQLRDAAGGQCRGGAHHAPGARAGRRDLGRARHRHHQARIPGRGEIAAFRAYKQKVDPQGRFNKGKLLPGGDSPGPTRRRSTCWAHESLILEQ